MYSPHRASAFKIIISVSSKIFTTAVSTTIRNALKLESQIEIRLKEEEKYEGIRNAQEDKYDTTKARISINMMV